MELIKSSREDGRLTDEQEDKINKLALDSQVRFLHMCFLMNCKINFIRIDSIEFDQVL